MTEFDRYGLLSCDCSDLDSLQPTLFLLSSNENRVSPTSRESSKHNAKRKKPVGSAYSNFFRTHQTMVKEKNPKASFGEISKEIATMWLSLDESTKSKYKRTSDMKKIEYMKQVALSRAVGVSQPLSSISDWSNKDRQTAAR